MKNFHSSFIVAALFAGLLLINAGCASSSERNSGADTALTPNRLTVSWLFNSETIEDEPHTRAWLVISGKMVQKEPAGKFYGGVMKSYSATENSNDTMEKGSLCGFMTYYSGIGAEVVARYDDVHHSITLLSRPVGEDSGEVPYKAIKTFTIRERGIIDSPQRAN